MMVRAFTTLTTALAAGLLLSCSGGNGDEDPSAGMTDQPAEARCSEEDRAETYTAGMEKTGDNGVSVAISDAMPSPPDVYDNTWTLEITDSSGAPIDDATLDITPFMPDHGHGSNVDAIVTSDGSGEYTVERVNFMMPGYWETTVMVETGAMSDEVVFKFCVE